MELGRRRSTWILSTALVCTATLAAHGSGQRNFIGEGSPDWNDGSGGVNTYIIDVPNSGTIASVNSIGLDIFHTWVGDLIITIEHNGTTVTLLDRPGFPANGFGNSDDLTDGADGAGAYTFFESGASNFPELSAGGVIPEGGYNSAESLQAFAGMDKMGRWTLTIVDDAAGDEGFVERWLLSVQNEEGACCLPDGACFFGAPSDCSGVYQGDGTTCISDGCPVEVGGCCREENYCTNTNAAACEEDGGAYLGDGAFCITFKAVCPTTKGACCFTNGTCIDMEPLECLEAGGTFQGIEVSCATAECRGACCYPGTGACGFVSESRCRAGGGAYQGDGMPCAGAGCELIGACCAIDGSCYTTSASECVLEVNGAYQGHGSDCKEANCPDDSTKPKKIACCLAGGVCQDTAEGSCLDQGGEVNYAACATTACVGACCFIGPGTCSVYTQTRCRTAGGVFQGSGTNCAGGCNQQPAAGACCAAFTIAGVPCMMTDAKGCAQAAGGYAGDGTDCITVDCDPFVGGCCAVGVSGCGFDCTLTASAEACEMACEFATFNGLGTDCTCNALTCACDLDQDGVVGFQDLLALLAVWGPCAAPCPADADGDGNVEFSDLLLLLTEWGTDCGV